MTWNVLLWKLLLLFVCLFFCRLMDEGYEIALFCDLHGHSRKHNVFMYGCASDQATASRRFQAQLLPFILSQNAPDYVSQMACPRLLIYVLIWRNKFSQTLSTLLAFYVLNRSLGRSISLCFSCSSTWTAASIVFRKAKSALVALHCGN